MTDITVASVIGYAAVAETSEVQIASVVGYASLGQATDVTVASAIGYASILQPSFVEIAAVIGYASIVLPSGGAFVLGDVTTETGRAGTAAAHGGRVMPSGAAVTPTPTPLTTPQLPQPGLDLSGRAGLTQMRLFVGPPWRRSNESEFWDFSGLDLTAYSPAVGSTVASNVGSSDASVTVTDATGWPLTGGVWLGPGATGESWAYATYTGRSGNVLTGLSRDTVDAEYSGEHTAGAEAHFWYPLTMDDGRFTYRESMDQRVATSTWSMDLSGVNCPVGVLRAGHLVLVQIREISGAGWGSWTTWAIGWLTGANPTDDETKTRRWTAGVGALDAVALQANVIGLHVGERDAADEGSASASGTLSPVYKAIGDGTGEVDSENDVVTPGRAIDSSLTTDWHSGRYYGEDNPLPSPGASAIDGVRDDAAITQVHINPYTGQGDGYRWVEITWISDLSGDFWLIAGIDYMVRFEDGYGAGKLDFGSGDRIILAENPDLFSSENPENEAAAVLDLADWSVWLMNNQKYSVTTGATGGTFTLTVDGQTTSAIAYNATAATVQSALAGLSSVGTDNVRVEGNAGAWGVTFVNDLGREYGPGMTGDGAGLSGGTLSVTQTQSPAFPWDTGADGTTIFDHASASGGMLRLFHGPTGTGHSQVVWGTTDPMTAWSPTWTGSALSAPGAGETMRMLFSPSSPTVTADFWQVGRIATPGYAVEAADSAWLLIDLPTMGLKLAGDITDSSPGAGDALSIENAAGASAEGLPASGTIQVGNEQITYSGRDFDAGTVTVSARGANGTAAAAHFADDPLYFVDGAGVATDAYPIETVRLRRSTGLAVPEDFVIRVSALSSARNPEQANYTVDYGTLATVTGNALESYSLDLSATTPRIRWLLVEVTAMTDAPSRVRIGEVDAVVDPGVLATGTTLASGTVADAVDALLDQAGLPSGVLVDAGDTLEPDQYTTAGGSLWSILADLADFAGARIRIGRDSKLHVSNDPFWQGTPTPDGAWGRGQVRHVSATRAPAQAIGQLELTWRRPDDPAEYTVLQPSTQSRTGQTVQVGPYVYADESAATVAALKRFWQARRPYSTVMELAFPGTSLTTGQVYTLTWDLSGRTEIRDYMLLGLNLEFKDYAWATVVTGIQIEREDER